MSCFELLLIFSPLAAARIRTLSYRLDLVRDPEYARLRSQAVQELNSFDLSTDLLNDLSNLKLDQLPSASLSTLPPELLREIVESTLPNTVFYRHYLDRQAILRSIVLVSRRFREIALPLLYKIVWVQGDEVEGALDSIEANSTFSKVKEMVIEDGNFQPDRMMASLERLYKSSPMVSTLVLIRRDGEHLEVAAMKRFKSEFRRCLKKIRGCSSFSRAEQISLVSISAVTPTCSRGPPSSRL
jgi:hypothetical protein